MTCLGGAAASLAWLIKIFASRGDNLPPDDSFIQLVYVRHFASVGRFYWNVEDGPVDGFTSVLDTVLKSLAVRSLPRVLDIDVAWWATMLFSFAAIAATAATAGYRNDVGLRRAALVFAAVCAVILRAGYAESVSFMLETPLFIALLAALVAALCRGGERPRFGLVVVLLVAIALTRPEGLAAGACGLAMALWEYRRDLGRSAVIASATAWGAAVIGYFAWHVHVFGAWAPNTYYAKTSAVRWNEVADGLRYVFATARVLSELPMFVWLLAAPVVCTCAAWGDERARRAALVATTVALVLLAAVVLGGGDCYRGARFVHAPLVLSATALVLAAAHLRRPWRAVAGYALGIAAAAAVFGRVPQHRLSSALKGNAVNAWRAAEYLAEARSVSWRAFYARPMPDVRHEFPASLAFDCERRLFETLAQAAGDGAIAQADYQIAKYFADSTRVVDLMGLNDKRRAHEPVFSPVGLGKFSVAAALRADADIWLYGPGWEHSDRLATRRTNVGDLFRPELVASEGGVELPTPAEVEQVAGRYAYVAVAIERCGTFRFLARRDRSSVLAATENGEKGWVLAP